MIRVGQIVKLKNPKKREAKRRWRVKGFPASFVNIPHIGAIEASPMPDDLNMDISVLPMTIEHKSTGVVPGTVELRRLDTVTHRLERLNEANLVPISFWERITKEGK